MARAVPKKVETEVMMESSWKVRSGWQSKVAGETRVEKTKLTAGFFTKEKIKFIKTFLVAGESLKKRELTFRTVGPLSK